MFVGGLRAVLLQSMHPLAMAGVAEHSGYRGDPWGRLQRTGSSSRRPRSAPRPTPSGRSPGCAACTGGCVGTARDGTPYAASDPHLLRWVHVAEADSFLRAHQRYGARRSTTPAATRYVAQTADVAEALGVVDAPRNRAELDAPAGRVPTRAARHSARPGPLPGSCC